MGLFDRSQLAEHEAPLVQDLFARIVEAQRGDLPRGTDMAEYLLATWRNTAEVVMRPLQKWEQLESELRQLRDQLSDDVPV